MSRVLNDSAPVNDTTRNRVEDAVGFLRYVPHACLVHATEHTNRYVRRHEVVATQLAIRNTCGPHDYPRR